MRVESSPQMAFGIKIKIDEARGASFLQAKREHEQARDGRTHYQKWQDPIERAGGGRGAPFVFLFTYLTFTPCLCLF